MTNLQQTALITSRKNGGKSLKMKLLILKQFLLLSQCFQKSSAAEASESVYMWERFIWLKTRKIGHYNAVTCDTIVF